ncbi:unnamed protein product, partial [Onchocerca flexuosa]|uniref:Secreted protein n=1 Tax=Onchocerca flexuosa TaxID=387005 RepID=A0A183HVR9_9BILA
FFFFFFFQGVGALGLQYILHLCLLRFIRTVIKYGNRATSVQQEAIVMASSTSSHRLTPLLFDSPSSENGSSSPHTEDISDNFRARYPAFGQTVSTFGRTSPQLLASSTSNFFSN